MPIFHMLDENGKLVPILGWKYEDFRALYERAETQKQPDQPPRYILQSMSASGTAKADYAELKISLKLWTRDERWTRVPLGLEQALLLSEPVEYKGGGQCFLHVEEGGKGHVAWVRGAAEGQHELALNVWVPLTTAGDETRLRLSAPPDTNSELRLTVPVAGSVGRVSEGAVLSPPSAAEGDTTELVAQWAGGEFELTWRGADTQPSGTRPILEAKGFVEAKIDQRNVVLETRLTVQGKGRPFDRFRVVLPRGAELIPGNEPGYTVVEVADRQAAEDEALVEVRREKPLPEPMEVRLTTRQSRTAAGVGGWFELGGFEVIDAVQQWGHMAVTSAGNGHVRCLAVRGVRQIEALPQETQEAFQGQNVVALFEYFSQPFSLTARVLENKTHVRVEPKYRILVDDGRARLEADLKYTVRGAQVFALEVVLPGWELDEVGPDTLVAVDAVATDPSGVVSIPLTKPSTGEIEISLRAHQEITPDSPLLSLALPRPQVDSLSPAELTVVPEPNVELTLDPDHMVGLASQQVPLSYRAEAAEATFAALFKVHPQEITVEVSSEITLTEGKEAVRQTLTYGIAYEPLERLTFEAPRALADSGKLEVSQDGQPLSLAPPPGQAVPVDASTPIRLQVGLPAPRIGTCKLEIRYPIEVEKLSPKSSVLCRVPLVMPGEGELSKNEVFVTAPKGIKVQCLSAEGPWTMLEADTGWLPRPGGAQLAAKHRASQIDLRIHQEEHEATVVERAWVQTDLTQGARRERAVFAFTTEQKELELVLPDGVDLRWVRLFVGPENVEDRKLVEVPPTSERRLKIPLPGDSTGRLLWLEAWYVFSDPRPSPGRLWIELPRLEADVWAEQMYWELVLPRNEHLIVAPEGFTTEYVWGWTGSFWGREPALEQSQLEEWSGAEPRGELSEPSGAASRYLFSRPGHVKQLDLRTGDRWLIVLGVSSAVLAAGLLLIYVPASRHPAALLAVAVALFAGAVLFPGPALLAAEAGSLGLTLALAAGLLYRTLGRGRGGAARRETSSSVLDKNSTQTQYRPVVDVQPASTDTIPLEVLIPTPDSSS
ncbi:MAG: hypothetical protein ABIK89_23700 [Planctomycetota bacterium]